MTPLSGATLLGARLDGIDPSPLVAGVYLVSGVLLLTALWVKAGRFGSRIAMTAIALAVAATLYSHDVVNLPEIVSMVVIGGSIGLMLARRCAPSVLPGLVVAGHGLLGLAAMATGAALLLNPFAFGLLSDDGVSAPGNGVMLGAGIAVGAAVLAGSLVTMVRRTQAGLAFIGGGAGWAAAALGFALGNSAMVMAGGLAGAAGWRLAWRARMTAQRALPDTPPIP